MAVRADFWPATTWTGSASDLQFSGLGGSGGAPVGVAVVTTIVPTYRVLSPSWPPGADAVRTESPSSTGVLAATPNATVIVRGCGAVRSQRGPVSELEELHLLGLDLAASHSGGVSGQSNFEPDHTRSTTEANTLLAMVSAL